MKFWYAVNTKTRCEAFACASLERLGVEVFLPMLKEDKTVRGRRCLAISPLFPGYLFARFEIRSQYRTVTYARGVKQIVSFCGGPSVVDDSIIEVIRGQGTDGVIELSDNRFSPGQVVRIKDGPLFGLEAVFEKKLSGNSRAVLLLKAISFQARIILGSQHVVNL